MAGSIIDAEKLQNEQFVKYNWLICANNMDMMIIFNVVEKDIQKSVKYYNISGKLNGITYTYKKVIVHMEVVS